MGLCWLLAATLARVALAGTSLTLTERAIFGYMQFELTQAQAAGVFDPSRGGTTRWHATAPDSHGNVARTVDALPH